MKFSFMDNKVLATYLLRDETKYDIEVLQNLEGERSRHKGKLKHVFSIPKLQ